MGEVGLVGDWKRGCVKVPIDGSTYFRNLKTGVWYDSDGETDFEIEFDLDGRMVFFDAPGRQFVSEEHKVLTPDANAAIERAVKDKCDLNGNVSFYSVERKDIPIYRN